MLPWIPGHPGIGLYIDDENRVCNVCGSTDLKMDRKFAYTPAGKYNRYRCEDCGKWQRGRKNLLWKERRQCLTANIV